MKLLIMGAGYVGLALLKSLQTLPYEVLISTTSEEKRTLLQSYGSEVLWIPPDNLTALKEAIQACDGMVVMVAPKASQSYQDTYLKTAERIVSALDGRKTPFYLLYTSSTSVCEGTLGEWVTEETALSPSSENARLLLATERLFLGTGVDACVLRLGGIYGPERELEKRAQRFSGKDLPGTGDEPTNHIHQADIVRGILFCLENRLTGVYHLVNDSHMTRQELYSRFCGAQGIPGPNWKPELMQAVKKGYKVSNQKIKDTGFDFKHSLSSSELTH